jgi:hypothetical protein
MGVRAMAPSPFIRPYGHSTGDHARFDRLVGDCMDSCIRTSKTSRFRYRRIPLGEKPRGPRRIFPVENFHDHQNDMVTSVAQTTISFSGAWYSHGFDHRNRRQNRYGSRGWRRHLTTNEARLAVHWKQEVVVEIVQRGCGWSVSHSLFDQVNRLDEFWFYEVTIFGRRNVFGV